MKNQKIVKYDDQLPILLTDVVHEPEAEFHLRDIWNILLKRKWTILSFLIIVVLVVTMVTFSSRPMYMATITLEIKKEKSNILSFQELIQIDTRWFDYYETEYRKIKSKALAKKIVEKLQLYQHPEFIGTQNNGIKAASIIKIDPILENRIANALLGHITVLPIKKSRLVKVNVTSHYPKLASQIANTLGESYIEMNLENKRKATREAAKWLKKELKKAKAKLERSEEKLRRFARLHNIVSLEDKENVIMQNLIKLNESYAEARAERIGKESLYKQTLKGDPYSLPSVVNNDLINKLKDTYIQLSAEYNKLSVIYKPAYPKMKRIKKQMKKIKSQIDKEVKRIVESIKSDYESALKKEKMLEMVTEAQKKEAMRIKELSIQYNILKREVESNREIYNGLLQKNKEANVSVGISTSNIRIVDKADTPLYPYKPRKMFNIMLAIIIGLFGGVGLAFFFEYLDNTLKTPEDVEKYTRYPTLGIIPSFVSDKKVKGKKRVQPVETISFTNPKSMVSEAFRTMRTSIILSFINKNPKKLLVTSPSPSEGKTTVALNLAITLALAEHSVLLIDSDMRQPGLHKIFGSKNLDGFSNLLAGNAKINKVLKISKVPNLSYISSGPIPPNPTELLGTKQFSYLLAFLTKKFDYIIFDSPPTMGFADSLILSSMVDGTILVIEGGKTTIQALKKVKDLFRSINSKILGVVINNVDMKKMRYNYYYKSYYKDYYYYGDSNKNSKK